MNGIESDGNADVSIFQVIGALSIMMDMKRGVLNETVKENRADELSAMYNMMMDNKKKQSGLLHKLFYHIFGYKLLFLLHSPLFCRNTQERHSRTLFLPLLLSAEIIYENMSTAVPAPSF